MGDFAKALLDALALSRVSRTVFYAFSYNKSDRKTSIRENISGLHKIHISMTFFPTVLTYVLNGLPQSLEPTRTQKTWLGIPYKNPFLIIWFMLVCPYTPFRLATEVHLATVNRSSRNFAEESCWARDDSS